jgi:hypothetical protein
MPCTDHATHQHAPPSFSTVAGPFPFESSTTNTTVNFGISNHRDFDGTSIHQPTQNDWGVGLSGAPNDLSHRKATSWDTQTVCLQYFTGTGATMSSCMVPGSPYMTFTFSNAIVNIQSLNGNLGTIQWVTTGRNSWLLFKARLTLILTTHPLFSVHRHKAQRPRLPTALELIFSTH